MVGWWPVVHHKQEKIGSFVCAFVCFCAVYSGNTWVSSKTDAHSDVPNMQQFSGTLHALPPFCFARAINSKTKKKNITFAHLSVPWVFCSKCGGISLTLELSLTVPFPSFQGENIYIYSMGFWSIPWCTWDGVGDSRKVSGTWALCTLDKVLC